MLITNRPNNWGIVKTIAELTFEEEEWPENTWPRKAIHLDCNVMWKIGGMPGLWLYRDRNPHMDFAVQSFMDTFRLADKDHTTYEIPWVEWDEWMYADPTRGFSEHSLKRMQKERVDEMVAGEKKIRARKYNSQRLREEWKLEQRLMQEQREAHKILVSGNGTKE